MNRQASASPSKLVQVRYREVQLQYCAPGHRRSLVIQDSVQAQPTEVVQSLTTMSWLFLDRTIDLPVLKERQRDLVSCEHTTAARLQDKAVAFLRVLEPSDLTLHPVMVGRGVHHCVEVTARTLWSDLSTESEIYPYDQAVQHPRTINLKNLLLSLHPLPSPNFQISPRN